MSLYNNGMEQEAALVNEEQIDYEGDIKRFRSSFLLFLIGQIIWTISAFSFGATFKFLPHWLSMFNYFNLLGHPIIVIALLRLRKLNKDFLLSLITMGLYLTTAFIYAACKTSNDPIYLAISKGMDWSKRILMCLMYIYTFLGCYHFFTKHGMEKGAKTSRKTSTAFFIIYGLYFFFEIFSRFSFIMYNTLLNRIFTYSSWFMELLVYVYAVVIVFILVIYFFKMTRKEKE